MQSSEQKGTDIERYLSSLMAVADKLYQIEVDMRAIIVYLRRHKIDPLDMIDAFKILTEFRNSLFLVKKEK